ncbi:MAG: ROK family transcriptional regulator [Eubacteriales bacterium]|nr:ROK family transcriptional regulator [Eubacteriales bacterium]
MGYNTGDKQLIKEINKASIFQVVHDIGPISRADIAKILKLTSATVSSNMAELIDEGIVKEIGTGVSSGGRKPVLVTISDSSVCFLGVDIHKDGAEAAVVSLTGRILAIAEQPFQHETGNFEHDVLACIRAVRGMVQGVEVKSIGIGMHGIVDTTKSISVFAPAMALRNFDLKTFIEREEHLPVYIDNDANAMALGESWFGQAKQVKNYVFLNVGRGIGSGIVLNGEVFRGSRYAAGEIGHIRVVDNGIQCVCGKYGCLDTVATEYTVIRDTISAIHTGIKSEAARLVSGNLGAINIDTILKAAASGDDCVLDILNKTGRYIGVALSYMINILNPEMIILGGSMSRLGEYMMDSLQEAAISLSMKECSDGVKIVLSTLRGNAGVVGAATLGMRNLFPRA